MCEGQIVESQYVENLIADWKGLVGRRETGETLADWLIDQLIQHRADLTQQVQVLTREVDSLIRTIKS